MDRFSRHDSLPSLSASCPHSARPARLTETNAMSRLGSGASLRQLHPELPREGGRVPNGPELDHLAPGEAKEIGFLHIDGLSGRRPRSPVANLVDAPMRTREVDVRRHDVSLSDEVVDDMVNIGEDRKSTR